MPRDVGVGGVMGVSARKRSGIGYGPAGFSAAGLPDGRTCAVTIPEPPSPDVPTNPDVPHPGPPDPRGPRPDGPPVEPPMRPLEPYDPDEPGAPKPGTRAVISNAF